MFTKKLSDAIFELHVPDKQAEIARLLAAGKTTADIEVIGKSWQTPRVDGRCQT